MAKKSTGKANEGQTTIEGIGIRPISPETREHFKAFMDALATDSIFDPSEENVIRQGAAAYDEKRVIPALANIAATACHGIREQKRKLDAFAETAKDDAHFVFNNVGNAMTMGELMAWVANRHQLHFSQVADYRKTLESVLKGDPAVFKFNGDSVYRARLADGKPTGVQLPNGQPTAATGTATATTSTGKRRGRKPGSKNKTKTTSNGSAESGGKIYGGRWGGMMAAKLGVSALTKADYNAVSKQLKKSGVNLNKASSAQVKEAAEAAGMSL